MKIKFLILLLLLYTFNQQILARAGDLDTTFSGDGIAFYQYSPSFSQPSDFVSSAVQSDGKIIFAAQGQISSTGGSADGVIVHRYNSDGSFDTAFGTNGVVTTNIGNFEGIAGVLIQPDGKIIVSGERYTSTTQTDFFVLRYNSNGSPDNSFGGNGLAVANIIGVSNERGGNSVLQPDGKIIVVGQTDNQTNYASIDWAIVRFNADGSLDSTFDSDGKVVISLNGETEDANSVAIHANGKIVVSGFSTNGTDNDFTTIRLNSNGTIDQSFGNAGIVRTPTGLGNDWAKSVKIQNDNKILVAGGNTNGTNNDVVLVRYNENGTLDTTYGIGGIVTATFSSTSNEIAYDLEIQADGKSVISTKSGTNAAIMRFNTDGSLDNSFGSNGKTSSEIRDFTSAYPYSIALQNDGKIVISGIAYWLASSGPTFFFTARYLNNTASKSSFDFDGDRKTDVSIHRPSVGEWWYLRSSDSSNRAFQFGNMTDKIVPADYTGDGKTDIAFWRESSGEWFILRSEDSSFYSFPFGVSGDKPAPADFDGDGKADPALFRPSDATWYILNSSGGTRIQQFGTNGDLPVANDYDGDGKTDLAVFRPSSSQWWINRSSNQTTNVYNFGTNTDKLVPADYTGDGKTDVAFWRPTSGEWFIWRSEDASFYSFPFGASGDIPTPGDYDGDGKADAAVFRTSNNTWYLLQSTSGFTAVGFGADNDLPIPSSFIP